MNNKGHTVPKAWCLRWKCIKFCTKNIKNKKHWNQCNFVHFVMPSRGQKAGQLGCGVSRPSFCAYQERSIAILPPPPPVGGGGAKWHFVKKKMTYTFLPEVVMNISIFKSLDRFGNLYLVGPVSDGVLWSSSLYQASSPLFSPERLTNCCEDFVKDVWAHKRDLMNRRNRMWFYNFCFWFVSPSQSTLTTASWIWIILLYWDTWKSCDLVGFTCFRSMQRVKLPSEQA